MAYENPEYEKMDQESPEFIEAAEIMHKIEDMLADGSEMGAIKFIMDLLAKERKSQS